MNIGKRLLALIITYWITITIIFILPRLIPQNPAWRYLENLYRQYALYPETLRAYELRLLREYGVGMPLWWQYMDFLVRMFQGDLGTSITFYPAKVIEIFLKALPWTLVLLIPVTLLSWTTGTLVGAYVGYKRGSKVDKLFVGLSYVLSNIPSYWLALLMIFTFAFTLKLFPSGGGLSPGAIPSLTTTFIFDFLRHYTLPFITLYIVMTPGWAGSMRALISTQLESDYVNYLRAMGVKDKIIYKYALRYAIIPQLTSLGIAMGGIVMGNLFVETVFSYPGVGYFLAAALGSLDYPLIQGFFVLVVAVVFATNFIVDLIRLIIDPRARA
jgi:peptide/nickel transport system permease protein